MNTELSPTKKAERSPTKNTESSPTKLDTSPSKRANESGMKLKLGAIGRKQTQFVPASPSVIPESPRSPGRFPIEVAETIIEDPALKKEEAR